MKQRDESIFLNRIKKLDKEMSDGTFSPHKWRVCHKKKFYETEFEVIDAFYKAKRDRPEETENLKYYQCKYCGKYHLGHKGN